MKVRPFEKYTSFFDLFLVVAVRMQNVNHWRNGSPLQLCLFVTVFSIWFQMELDNKIEFQNLSKYGMAWKPQDLTRPDLIKLLQIDTLLNRLFISFCNQMKWNQKVCHGGLIAGKLYDAI